MSNLAQPTFSLKRDSLIVGLIGSVHFISHFFQLTVAPLFPLLHDAFQVGYVQLGSVVTTFYLFSGVCQAFAGIYVDRHGARPVLMFGVISMALAITLAGFVPHFWMLYPLMALAGIGNSVFHPADFAALSHQVSPSRLGRAFSIHSSCGSLGYALAPVIVGTIAAATTWRIALISAGVLGGTVALLVWRFGHHLVAGHGYHEGGPPQVTVSYRKLIAMPALLFAFGYFLFTASAGTAMQTFSITAFVEAYGVSLKGATAALSAYLVGAAAGMLIGGVIADHTTQHVRVAVSGLALCAVILAVIAAVPLPFTSVIVLIGLAGMCQGITTPSRDILVRGVAPPGSTGRVFGFVYSGVDAGSTIAPLIFGAFIDHQAYHSIFAGMAVLFAAAILTVFTLGRRQTVAPSV